jgi:hypothetical protein
VVFTDANVGESDFVGQNAFSNNVANDLRMTHCISVEIDGGVAERVKTELEFLRHAGGNRQFARSIPVSGYPNGILISDIQRRMFSFTTDRPARTCR